jgi:Nif-specific regulatory protein
MSSTQDYNHIALATVYEIAKILGSSLALHDTLQQALNVISSHLNMGLGMVSLMQESGKLSIIASIGLTREEMKRGEFEAGEGVTGQIFKHGVPIAIPDIAQEPLFLNKTGAHKEWPRKQIAFLGVPIKIDRTCIGVLSFQFEKTEAINEFQSRLQLLTMVASLIGQSVRLNQQVTADRQQLLQEKSQLQKDLANKYSLNNVIGQSKRMQEVFADVHMAAPGNSTVLLRGESGTGKEVIARAIHFLSARKDAPFIKVNCAALSENLLESELFGHEKGAFTGALQQRKGRFEQAHGGTLFLDEIGDISPGFQVKLLRVLQERELERVGGNTTIKVDVRLIFATNRNLEEAVSSGEFRSDLYFRINVISIFLPPLRERREDIPLLVENIMRRFNREHNTKIGMTPEALQVLIHCHWPGNVRELENCVARFSTLSHGNIIQSTDIPCQTNNCLSSSLWKFQAQHKIIPITPKPDSLRPPSAINTDNTNNQPPTERERLLSAMEKSGWVQAKAARILNLTPRQIGYALKKYKLEIKKL